MPGRVAQSPGASGMLSILSSAKCCWSWSWDVLVDGASTLPLLACCLPAGGVARNVAEALALLLKTAAGASGSASSAAQLPLLVSVVGDDLAGQALLQHWRQQGCATGFWSAGLACLVPFRLSNQAGEQACLLFALSSLKCPGPAHPSPTLRPAA